MAQTAAETAAGVMCIVAIEQHFPEHERVIDDPLAYRLLPLGMKGFVQWMRLRFLREWMLRTMEAVLPGLWSGLACRKRYIDERLAEAAPQMKAVVLLGAGFDTRVYRLPEVAQIDVWEVDQPANCARKRRRVRWSIGRIPAHRHFVPMDFEDQELGSALATHGYSAEVPTFFVWEAVSQYLTEAGVRSTFDFLAKAAPGSRLAFTYVRKDFLDGRNRYGSEWAYQRFVLKDRTWHFGMEPDQVEDFFGSYGWRVLEHAGYEELAERYVKPTGRELVPALTERMVYAEKR